MTTLLTASLSGGADLPRLEIARLRATWLREVARAIGLRALLDAAGITCSQRLGDLVAHLEVVQVVPEPDAVVLLGGPAEGGRRPRPHGGPRRGLGVAPRLEALLAVGVRPRQLSVRTLLVGMLLTQADHRPAHLTRVHAALVALSEADRMRLGVTVVWRRGPHTLTYRQVERAFSLVRAALGKDRPDGAPAAVLHEVLDALSEASVAGHTGSSSLAVDWTDVESFSTRRTKPTGTYADTEAAWGHRKGGGPGAKHELFFGYYLSLATRSARWAATPLPRWCGAWTSSRAPTTRCPEWSRCRCRWPWRGPPSATWWPTRAMPTGCPTTSPCRCGPPERTW